MLRTALAQLRLAPRRLLSAGTAILLGTAFVAAALGLGGSLGATLAAALATPYQGTDVVVTGQLPAADLARLRELPGADVVEGSRSLSVTAGGSSLIAVPAPQDRRLQWQRLAAGRLPAAAAEVAVDTGTADRLRLAPGTEVRLAVPRTTGRTRPADVAVRVVGVVDLGASPELAGLPLLVAVPADLDRWATTAGSPAYDGASLVAAPGTSPGQLRDAVAAALAGRDLQVRTGAEQTALIVRNWSGNVLAATGLLLAFATVALFVAALVIANTFAILVAQRTRELALLRCVGATGAQVRRSVLAEAAVLGVVASIAGTAVGLGLVLALAAGLRGLDLPVAVRVHVPSAGWVLPLGIGVVTTLLAAAVPARRAMRISPLAALRPADAPVLRSRAGRLRVAAAVVLTGAGAALLIAGALLPALPVGLLGGMVSIVGVLVAAPLVVPRVVAAAGGLAGRAGGLPVRLAAANALRNPGRTTATATALLIGSTLVTLMTVGAASARASADTALSDALPVDVVVGASDGLDVAGEALPAEVPGRVAALPAVAGAVPVRSVAARAGTAGQELVLRGLEPEEARRVLRSAAPVAGLAPGTVVLGDAAAERLGRHTGDRLRLRVGSRTQELTVAVSAAHTSYGLVTSGDLAQLAPAAPVTQAWLRLRAGADVGPAVHAVEDAVPPGVQVGGDAEQRASFDRVLDTMLLVVTGLLGVAVLIALVGVANTLSLSVLERGRESALLRALGLTRGQLRGVLAAEAGLVAGVGALLGVALGTAYGWAGTAAALGRELDVRLAVPAGRLGLVVAVTLLAGLLASYLPGRRAARTSPVLVTAE